MTNGSRNWKDAGTSQRTPRYGTYSFKSLQRTCFLSQNLTEKSQLIDLREKKFLLFEIAQYVTLVTIALGKECTQKFFPRSLLLFQQELPGNPKKQKPTMILSRNPSKARNPSYGMHDSTKTFCKHSVLANSLWRPEAHHMLLSHAVQSSDLLQTSGYPTCRRGKYFFYGNLPEILMEWQSQNKGL